LTEGVELSTGLRKETNKSTKFKANERVHVLGRNFTQKKSVLWDLRHVGNQVDAKLEGGFGGLESTDLPRRKELKEGPSISAGQKNKGQNQFLYGQAHQKKGAALDKGKRNLEFARRQVRLKTEPKKTAGIERQVKNAKAKQNGPGGVGDSRKNLPFRQITVPRTTIF